jgi:nucleoside-diphosphate-sugar epimerase
VFFAKLPVLPLEANWRYDFVPADYVGAGIVAVHMQDAPEHDAYNLSSGLGSPTFRDVVSEMERHGGPKHVFLPRLERPFGYAIDKLMNTPREWGIAPAASLMKVFFPYITYDTVFDNSRIQKVLGYAPKNFTDYCYDLYKFATEGGFKYPYKPWPDDVRAAAKRSGAISPQPGA